MVACRFEPMATAPLELRSQHFRADRHGFDASHVRLKPDTRAVKDLNPSVGIDFNFGIDDIVAKVPPAG